LPEATDDLATDHVEWTAVEEGFRLLERDLARLLVRGRCSWKTYTDIDLSSQQFIEVNATGFRKILKKWDKRSKSQTKELYLARAVEVQPVFNRQVSSYAGALIETDKPPV
jgi:CDK inhibitor PHO81